MKGFLLELRDLSVSYGPVQAVSGVSLAVARGEIVALIGANGAGKTTILKAVSGLVPFRGEMLFQGSGLVGVPPERRVARGISLVPEGRGIFGNLTVMENLRLAAWTRRDPEGVSQDFERIFSLFPALRNRRFQFGATLSGGEQQMLALSRALVARAELLLLDELSMGLSPRISRELFAVLASLNREGTSILCVEQNARLALSFASRAYVLETGRIVLEGVCRDLAVNPLVKESYLGL